jgi:hypothetical protein
MSEVDPYDSQLAASLASVARMLGVEWESARSFWRDALAHDFDQQIVQPVLGEMDAMLRAFAAFSAAWSDIQERVRVCGGGDFVREEQNLRTEQVTAEDAWRASSSSERVMFGLDFGNFAHWRSEESIIQWETARGRQRNVDYGIEYVIRLPNNETVRYDYVDLQNHIIVDVKSAHAGETEADVALRYAEQCTRHKAAYSERFGIVPDYQYITYPSTTGLFGSVDDDRDGEGTSDDEADGEGISTNDKENSDGEVE